jgi:hypothetical protein
MLFTVADVEGRFGDLIREWTDLRAARSAFFGAFFGLIFAPPKFTEIRFSWLLHSIKLAAVPDAPSRLAAHDQGPLTSEAALQWIFEKVAAVEASLLVEQRDVFIKRVSEVYRKIELGLPFDPVAATWLTEMLRWVVKAFLLLQMPSVTPRATTILERSQHLAFVKQKIRDMH